MRLFNSHTHTKNSLDCTASAEEMCQSAVNAKFSGIAICDHCHGSNYITYSTYDVLKASNRDARRMAEQYSGKLEVFAGAEFGEILWNPDYIQRLIDSFELDIVLASVHRVRNVTDINFISRVNFQELSTAQLYNHIKHYFLDVLETAEKCDFDVLSHLTLILRYITGKFKINVDLAEFMPIIDKILKVLISREKALELNTSEATSIGLMPDVDLLNRYRSFGGELITIGTDAHNPQKINHCFAEAINALRKCGFSSYFYYRNRKAQREYID